MIINKIINSNRQRKPADTLCEESLDERMRIFEDEIIKRIKIIQNFVKMMDGKVKKIAAV